MKLHQQPLTEKTAERTTETTTDTIYTTTRTKPKVGIDTQYNLNAQESRQATLELQKQEPELAEQAPPHEITSAALQQK